MDDTSEGDFVATEMSYLKGDVTVLWKSSI